MKKIIVPLIVLLSIFWASNFVMATNGANVTVCHATGSQQNPYQKITVDSSAVDGQGNGDHNTSQHQNGNDIIPPGFWDSNGRNWTTQNQAIWNNNCNVPEPTNSPTPTRTPTPTNSPTPTMTPGVTITITPEATPSATVTPPFDPCDGKCDESPTPTASPTAELKQEPLTDNRTYSQPPTPDGSKSDPTCDIMKPNEPDHITFNNPIKNDHKFIIEWPKILNGDTVNIYYGEYGRPLEHAVANIPDDGHYEIKELKNNIGYMVCVEGKNRCAVGPRKCVDPKA